MLNVGLCFECGLGLFCCLLGLWVGFSALIGFGWLVSIVVGGLLGITVLTIVITFVFVVCFELLCFFPCEL